MSAYIMTKHNMVQCQLKPGDVEFNCYVLKQYFGGESVRHLSN